MVTFVSLCFFLTKSKNRSFESVTQSLFAINEFVIANVHLHLYFQLRIMYVKNILRFILRVMFKHYQSM